MPEAILDSSCAPTGRFDLIRLGRDHDGGYLVDRASVRETEALLSFGVNNDWSFESAFYDLRPVPLHAFDGSIGYTFFLNRCIKRALNVTRPSRFAKAYGEFSGYRRFFRGDRRHYPLMVSEADGRDSISLRAAFDRFAARHPGKTFLKIDIEGAEYGLLDQISGLGDKLSGLAIEFHDVPEHEQEIRRFVRGFALVVAHCHANNYGDLDPRGVPAAIEITFSRSANRLGSEYVLPHGLDMPNKPSKPEFRLKFGENLVDGRS